MRLNDVFFAGHAFCITLLTLMQICNLVVAAIAKLMSGELLSNFVDFIKKTFVREWFFEFGLLRYILAGDCCDGTNPLPLDRRIYSSAERGLKIGDPARVVEARPIQLSEFTGSVCHLNSFHGCVLISEFPFHFCCFIISQIPGCL